MALVVEIDSKSGFCFGVVRAIEEAERALSSRGVVYSLGDIVHNRIEVQRLESLGLQAISVADMQSVGAKCVLIRAHGEPPQTYLKARALGADIIDATCPVVARLQERVTRAYEQMHRCNGQVVLLGKRGHAEVVGLTGQVNDDVIVVEREADLEQIDYSRPIFFLSQTTQSISLFEHLAEIIRSRSQLSPSEVIVQDTICRQVSSREGHLQAFAKEYDVVIFVSGKKSSNGKVLFEVCRESNAHTYNIEEAHELQIEWFAGATRVGVCGATSTPAWLMEQVAQSIREINN